MSTSPSLRRIQADIRELAVDPSDRYAASPLEDDMFEWHFTIRGADGTDFQGGLYHGRILLPTDYPFKPPNIVFMNPSGRFETGVKVCLSFSAHHPELWQPAWGIRLILEALISFLPTPADGAIGSLDWSSNERKALAKKSATYCCPRCGPIVNLVPKIGSVKNSGTSTSRFQKEIEKLHQLQIESERKNKQLNNLDVSDGAEPSRSPLDDQKDTPTSEDEPALFKMAEPPSAAEDVSHDHTNVSSATPTSQSTHDREGVTEAVSTTSVKGETLPSSDQIIAADKSTAISTDTTTMQRQRRVGNSSSSPKVDFVPPLIVALFIVIVGIIVRKIISIIEELGVLDVDAK